MRIIGLTDDNGPAYHRIETPLMLMDGPDCLLTNVLKEEHLQKGCDVLYISRYAKHNYFNQILEWRAKYDFKLVIDIDDYWRLDRHHISADDWERNNVAKMFIDYIVAADAVTTTHERLREKILQHNDNVEVFPNAIPVGYEQFNINKIQSDKVRLFWQGSNTHRKDIQLLKNPLKRVHADLKNEVFMVFSGYKKSGSHTIINPDGSIQNVNNITECEEMVSSYTNSFRLDGVAFEATPVKEYYQAYKYCDIALVPLLDTSFNGYKSNLKILEAAAVGAPCIVSKVNPYLDMPVCYVENQTDWYKHIKSLVRDKVKREEMGAELFYYCDANFNFWKINELRKEFICSSVTSIF
jgi:glycosyltransferase involved in cell wall biosynthesis